MPTRSISLTEHYHKFVEAQICSGRFKNASEVMRAGLQLLEKKSTEQAEKLALLKKLSQEGFDDLDQGRGVDIESTESLSDLVSQLGKSARKRASS